MFCALAKKIELGGGSIAMLMGIVSVVPCRGLPDTVRSEGGSEE